MDRITSKELTHALEKLAEEVQKNTTTADQAAVRLKEMALSIQRTQRGLMEIPKFLTTRPSQKLKCPVFHGRAYSLNEDYHWSLEHTTKGELVLVPREKKKGTHGNADFYMEGGEHGN